MGFAHAASAVYNKRVINNIWVVRNSHTCGMGEAVCGTDNKIIKGVFRFKGSVAHRFYRRYNMSAFVLNKNCNGNIKAHYLF